MTLATAIERLRLRRRAIAEERARIIESSAAEVIAITQQLEAIDDVLAALANPVQVVALERLLAGLTAAGFKLVLGDK